MGVMSGSTSRSPIYNNSKIPKKVIEEHTKKTSLLKAIGHERKVGNS
mgnify:CR=1 FL=1